MTLASALLHAPRVGAREFRNKACAYIRRGKACLVTEHGQPAGVFLPYKDALELVDLIDELHDAKILKTIGEGRRAVKRGAKSISLSKRKRSEGTVYHTADEAKRHIADL